jgi:hypothetical protein
MLRAPHSLSLLLGAAVLLALPGFLAGACSAGGDGSGQGGGLSGSGDGGTKFAGSGGNGSGDPKTCEEAAREKTYLGCDFWPTVNANNVWSIFDFAVVVANAGDVPAEVVVDYQGNQIAAATVEPDALATLYLPWVPALKGPDADNCGSATPFNQSVRVPGGAFHLTSSRPVTVYQFNALEYKGEGGPPGKNWANCPGNQACPGQGPIGCFSFSNDASLLIPSTAMTGNYRIISYPGWMEGVTPIMGSTFTVTGTVDGTEVTVTLAPGAHALGGSAVPDTPGGGTLTFGLNAGDVVEVVGSPDSDFGGSLVKATHPVQVITGLPCVNIPAGSPACDHIEETVFPAETLGKHYFVVRPTGPNIAPVDHVVRLFGNVDNTTLTYRSGAPAGAPTTINAGQVVNLGRVSVDFEIEGDHEIGVATFQLGASIVDPGKQPPFQRGDPAQSLSTAVEQYRNKYIFLAPTDYDVSYVDIVQPLTAKVTIDGAEGPTPTAVGTSYGVSRIRLAGGKGGAHVLEASAPVGIQVVGYGAYTSYQYPGGLNLTAIAPPPVN